MEHLQEVSTELVLYRASIFPKIWDIQSIFAENIGNKLELSNKSQMA
jgi:hypothetical protein